MEMNFSIYKPALERQIQSWFWLNDLMRPWIISLDKLISVDGTTININLHGFNELYTDRYFRNKLEEICPVLIAKILKPGLKLFLQTIEYRAHTFSVNLSIGAENYTKVFTVMNPDWEDEI